MPFITRTSIFYVFKSLINKENYDNPETTDTSHTDKYDMSRTNLDDYIEM